MGYSLSKEELDEAYERFLVLADKKKEVFDEDLIEIDGGQRMEDTAHYKLEYLHTVSGTGTVPSSTVRLCIGGKSVQESAWGDGPVDATYAAIRMAAKAKVQVEDFAIRAVTSGSQALGEVTVHLSENGQRARGRGVSTDVVEASAQAYIDALNRLAAKSEKNAQTTV